MIRSARPEDAPAIAAVEEAAASHPWSLDSVEQTLALGTTRSFVVDDQGVIGHLLASAVVDEGEVLTLAVHPQRRREGLGRALLDACTRGWIEAGVRAGFLEVRADNDAAIALYRSAGWVEAGTRPRYYPGAVDALILRWSAP